MIGYRVTSGVVAGAYLSVCVSLLTVPPRAPVHSEGATVSNQVWPNALWVVLFGVTSLFMLVAVIARPQWVYLGHTAYIPTVSAYGIANLGVALINSASWLVFSACTALVSLHVLAIRRRPVLPEAEE